MASNLSELEVVCQGLIMPALQERLEDLRQETRFASLVSNHESNDVEGSGSSVMSTNCCLFNPC